MKKHIIFALNAHISILVASINNESIEITRRPVHKRITEIINTEKRLKEQSIPDTGIVPEEKKQQLSKQNPSGTPTNKMVSTNL
jgi:hypothetical protein